MLRLVDTPTNEMHTDAFVEEARNVISLLADYPVDITVIRGEELRLVAYLPLLSLDLYLFNSRVNFLSIFEVKH